MSVGTCFRVTSWKNYDEDGIGWQNYKSPKKSVAIMLHLGIEPKKLESLAERLDIEKMLNLIGWYRLDQFGNPISVIEEPARHCDDRTLAEREAEIEAELAKNSSFILPPC